MLLTKAGLSRLLAEVLVHDSDIDAFATQNFGNVVRRFSRGMDRAGKIAVLVENAELSTLLDKLRAAHPVATARNEHLLVEDKRVAGAPLPDTGPCIGRDTLIAELGRHLIQDTAAQALLVGPAGIGKTTVALSLLQSSLAEQRFGGRRFLAQLDHAISAASVLVEIARALDLPPEAPLRPRVIEALGRAPAFLVLDDIDVALQRDPANVFEILNDIAAIEGLSLLGVIRGDDRASPRAFRTFEVGPLGESAARDAFIALAGEARRSDPGLGHLLTEAGGVPLALTLIAGGAEGDSLEATLRTWLTTNNRLLMREDGPERPSPVEIAVQLAQGSGRVSDEARRLLSISTLLPNGIGEEDLTAIFPGTGPAAGGLLRAVGFVREAGRRLRLLRAVREVLSTQTPEFADLTRAIHQYTSVALAHGPKVGWPEGDASAVRLAADSDNIENMIMRGFEGPNRIASVDAAVALATFLGSSGHGSSRTVERARDMAREGGDRLGEADCTQALGDIALARGETDEARARYLDALPLFFQARAALSAANCLMRLGDIASARGELDEARLRYKDAVPYFRQVADKGGEATCLRNLGDIATTRDEHDEARASYKAALTLFIELDDRNARALCMKGLGDIAFNRSEYEEARERYEEVLPLLFELGDRLIEAQTYQNLGDIAFAQNQHGVAERHYQKALPMLREFGDKGGEASCLQSLGDVALACAEAEDAQAYYLSALPLLREVGEKMGEANCIQSLGDIALTHFEHDNARALYEEALGLFRSIKDEYSIGWTHYRLAQVAADPEIFRTHLTAARDAWASIARQDLIDDISTEFPGILP